MHQTKEELLTDWFMYPVVTMACGPLSIIKRIAPVAYRLSLPPIVKFHDIFQVSLLKKYVKDVDHVIDWFVLQVEPDGEF